jgi:N-acetylglucosamine kinase-like BadF-type ATPase
MSGRYYAGIDAGGTGTRCAVADEQGVVLGIGEGGPGNALISGQDRALLALRAAIAGAWGTHAPQPIAHLHLSIAGTLVPDGAEDLAARCSTSNDTAGAFAGALVHGPGIIIIAGTGSACYGEAGDGRTALIGGWGPLIGDEGSAYTIGRVALARLTWAVDGRLPHSPLTTLLIDRLGVSDRVSLQRRLYDPPVPREWVASLAGVVDVVAAQGDAQAIAIVRQAGVDLGQAVGDLACILDLQATPVRVSTIGGVFRAGRFLLGAFEERLGQVVPAAQVVPARFPAVIGALLLAYRAEGVSIDEPLLARLEASYRAYAPAR